MEEEKEFGLKYRMSPKIKEILEWVFCVLIAVVLALVVRYYVGTPTVVQQPSMFPTLKPDQRLILNRWSRTVHEDYQRGDIVTFEMPSTIIVMEYDADLSNPVAKYENEPKGFLSGFVYHVLEFNKTSYIKRVIGLPGEHVKIEDGKVYINGKELEEEYLSEDVVTMADGPYTDLVVPEGTYFLMGDNRTKSADCRRFGCIPKSKIESKVLVRFWPLNLAGKVD